MRHAIAVLGVLATMSVFGCTGTEGREAAVASPERPAPSPAKTDSKLPTTTAIVPETTLAAPPTTTPLIAEPTRASCSTADLSTDQRAALLVFAEIDNSPTQLLGAMQQKLGGIFITQQAVPLVADGTLAAAVAASDSTPLVAIDEEGGRVQRLQDQIGALPSAREMSTLGPDRVRGLAAAHGRRLADLGLNTDFAPVLDMVEDSDLMAGGGIGDRSFSADPTVTTDTARAFADGLRDASILPTYKHFPGHGHASGDSHKELPITPSIEQMTAHDLIPWADLLAPDEPPAAVMVGHLSVPGLTGGEPASVSRAAITDLLRNTMGFDGLVVTDDLARMDAIRDRYSVIQASVLAVAAGADMVLVPQVDSTRVVDALTSATEAGTIEMDQLAESADRVLLARGCS